MAANLLAPTAPAACSGGAFLGGASLGGASPAGSLSTKGALRPSWPCRGDSGDSMSTAASSEDAALDDEMLAMCRKIDTDGSGSISQLELITAVYSHPDVAAFVLPGLCLRECLYGERAFDVVDEMFEAIAGGRQRIMYRSFVGHFRRRAAEASNVSPAFRKLYRLMDADGNGTVSKLEFYEAVQRHRIVARLVLGNRHRANMDAEDLFDEVREVFDDIAGGKKRFDYADFDAFFRPLHAADPCVGRALMDRSSARVFIIGPGFGRQLNPRQGQVIEEAGFHVHWCWEGLPNPETPTFDARPYLEQIRFEIQQFQPHVVAAASKGGAFVAALWKHRLWRGPTLLINAHPSVRRIPKDMPVVLCHGANDEVYSTPRWQLRELISTGSPNRCFLFYTANSGVLPTGQRSRRGDQHNMQSLLTHDCLPRLLDATLSHEGPELHMVRSWRDRLAECRLAAEAWLGYTPAAVRRLWATRGRDERKLQEVPIGSEEFAHVVRAFKARPKEPSAYALSPPESWERVRVLRVDRVENAPLHEDCATPYYNSLRRAIEDQGLCFEPGVHTTWAFHGADAEAIDSIVSSPVAGFQPLTSGSRAASLWGSGTYFARDAKYVADGGFCGQPAADGTLRMLMCLLMSGMPCVGDQEQKGVLPFRCKPHRYNCTVDCLSSPEIYITQHAGAAHAAYLVTFA
uniref:EF-hand domain-containing protein n=1 Tax=Zooxanthella nutricula TaxID=1333877 RepID=A0A7S2QAL2_9DINO